MSTTTTTLPPATSAAASLRAKAHALTPDAYAAALRALVTASSALKFAQLAPGLYYYTPSYGTDGRRIIRVHSLTPAGRKVNASILSPKDLNPAPVGLYAGDYSGSFHAIDDATANLALITSHRDLVAQAVGDQLPCPRAVRCAYPELFVRVPNGCKAEDVREALTIWGRDKIATPEDIARVIASVQESIRHHDRHANLWATTGMTTSQADQDEARESLLNRLDFYRWVETHVQPGGVFAVETSP